MVVVATPAGRVGEFGLQVLVQRDVKEGVQGILALGGGDVGDAQALVLQVPLVGHLDDLNLRPVGARVRALDDVALHADAHAVLGQLGDALFLGADQRLHPVGHIVKQVVLRQLELGDDRYRAVSWAMTGRPSSRTSLSHW